MNLISTIIGFISGAVSPILTFFAGAVTAIFAEPIRQRWFRPVLALHFEKSDHYITKTPKGDHEAF